MEDDEDNRPLTVPKDKPAKRGSFWGQAFKLLRVSLGLVREGFVRLMQPQVASAKAELIKSEANFTDQQSNKEMIANLKAAETIPDPIAREAAKNRILYGRREASTIQISVTQVAVQQTISEAQPKRKISTDSRKGPLPPGVPKAS